MENKSKVYQKKFWKVKARDWQSDSSGTIPA
jgi:hypothetical protein